MPSIGPAACVCTCSAWRCTDIDYFNPAACIFTCPSQLEACAVEKQKGRTIGSPLLLFPFKPIVILCCLPAYPQGGLYCLCHPTVRIGAKTWSMLIRPATLPVPHCPPDSSGTPEIEPAAQFAFSASRSPTVCARGRARCPSVARSRRCRTCPDNP